MERESAPRMNEENERDMWDAIVRQETRREDRESDPVLKIGTSMNWFPELDTFEADLPGELVDLMPCDWCGRPVFDLVPFYGNIADPTHAYMICEDCNNDATGPDVIEDEEEVPF